MNSSQRRPIPVLNDQPPPAASTPRGRRDPAVSRTRKLGETLSTQYDTSEIEQADMASVLETVFRVCTLEEEMPKLIIEIHKRTGYYTIVAKNFTKYISGLKTTAHLVTDATPTMAPVIDWFVDPSTGTLIVKAKQVSSELPVQLPVEEYEQVSRPHSNKRGRIGDY